VRRITSTFENVCIPPARLSITHNSGKCRAELDISEPREAAPHHDISGWWIAGSGEVAAKPGNLREVFRQTDPDRRRSASLRDKLVEQPDFELCQDEIWFRLRQGTVDHRQPEYPPAQNAEDGDQPDQPFGRPEPSLLSAAAGFEDFVKGLDLPAQRIPAQLLDGIAVSANR
jgi:hypothetical protein